VKTASQQDQTGDGPPQMPLGNPNTGRIRVLDPMEAAALIKMDSRTLVRWARLGHVPAHPLGEGKRQLWRFIENELLEWFAKRSFQRKPPALSIETAIGARARRSA
jgi:hypothetical protein